MRAIIAMGLSLRLNVTAEGVETLRQLDMLRAHGCTFAQGYLLGRPGPADQSGKHAIQARSLAAASNVMQLAASA